MFAIIRLRGRVNRSKKVEDTFKMLHLNAPNNCVLIPETSSFKGMLNVIKDFCTWGEIERDVLIELLKRRLRKKGRKRVDEKTLKEITNFSSFEEFADALLEGKVKIKDFKELNPTFRLSPPSKGFKSIKIHYPKGDLGYRGKKINELLKRMI